MITVKHNTTLVGVSELRSKIDELLKKLRGTRIIIEKRHKPLAVLISAEEFEREQELLEIAEDIVFGYLAKERFENATKEDYVKIESVLRKTSAC